MNKRRIISSLLALVMVFSVMAGSTAFAEGTQTAAAEIEMLPMSDLDSQIHLLYNGLDSMKQSGALTWYYSVTDLDHDGNLEFIAASQHPADRSTNLKIWEVNEKRDGVNEIVLDLEEDESFPDILTDNADTYHNTETNQWFYMVYDNIVRSNYEVYTLKTAVTLNAGKMSYESYAVEHTEIKNGLRFVSHTDNTGFAISGDQYNAAGVNAFAGTERSNTNFDWFTYEDANSVNRIADSYLVFTGEKEPTEVFPVPMPAALQQQEASPSPSPTPSVTPTPIPTAKPTPVPQPPQPTYLMITKNPTNENDRKIGGKALFVACANVFDSLTWTMVAPNGGEYSLASFRSIFYGANVSGDYSTTLSIENVQQDMNCWGAYCTFYYNGQTARTSTAYLYVKSDPVPPTPPVENSMNGVVTDYLMSSVTMRLDNGQSVQVLKDICEVDGSLAVGCTCTVWYYGNSPTRDNIRYVFIYGEKQVGPVYGSMAGLAYHDTAFTIYIVLNNGQGYHVDGTRVNLITGVLTDGCSCVAYYMNYPNEDNIYQIDVYGTDPILPEPEPTWVVDDPIAFDPATDAIIYDYTPDYSMPDVDYGADEGLSWAVDEPLSYDPGTDAVIVDDGNG